MVREYVAIVVSTIDGKIARNDSHSTSWSSKEDKDFMVSKLNAFDVIFVGRKTYELEEEALSKRNCIVLTSSVSGEEKKTDLCLYLNPEKIEIGDLMKKNNYSKACVLGGARTYSYFLEKGLLNEIFLTIEPVVFGSGLSLFENEVSDTKFDLIEVKKLNEEGTVLLHYKKRIK